jgi:hypothetical protein
MGNKSKIAKVAMYALIFLSLAFVGGHHYPFTPSELYVRIIAIHDGIENGGTIIDIQELYWGMDTYPEKPVLLDHEYSTPNLVGRVIDAYPSLDARDDSQCLEVIVVIKDPYTIKMIMNGMFVNVSVGFVANVAECTVCGHDYLKGECSHWPGSMATDADGNRKRVQYILREIEFLEISIVAVPADRGARILDYDRSYDRLRDRAQEDMNSRFIVIYH